MGGRFYGAQRRIEFAYTRNSVLDIVDFDAEMIEPAVCARRGGGITFMPT